MNLKELSRKLVVALTAVILVSSGFSSVEKADTVEGHEDKEEFNAPDFIVHHVLDAHDFHIAGDLSLPLPIILWTEQGLVTFLSSEFHHDDAGKVVVEKGGQRFVKHHEHIYYASEVANEHGEYVELDESHHALNAAPVDLSITKNVFSMLLSVALIVLLFGSAAKAYAKRGKDSAPKGLQSWLEPLVLFVRDDIAKPNITASKVDKFTPYLLTAFFFIWINNLLGLIPVFPGSANLTGNIAVTLVLAVFTLVITNINGNKAYWGHIFATPGVPKWLSPIMIPVEIVGVLSKPFALMVRLFANISAGHIIILSLISIIFIFKNAAWGGLSAPLALFISVLELLVAVLQAYVFTLLSALFIGMAVDDHH